MPREYLTIYINSAARVFNLFFSTVCSSQRTKRGCSNKPLQFHFYPHALLLWGLLILEKRCLESSHPNFKFWGVDKNLSFITPPFFFIFDVLVVTYFIVFMVGRMKSGCPNKFLTSQSKHVFFCFFKLC